LSTGEFSVQVILVNDSRSGGTKSNRTKSNGTGSNRTRSNDTRSNGVSRSYHSMKCACITRANISAKTYKHKVKKKKMFVECMSVTI